MSTSSLNPQVAIAIIGKPGAGKGTVTKMLIQILGSDRVTRCSSGELLVEGLRLFDIPPTRANLQHLPTVLDQGFGDGTFSRAMAKRLRKQKTEIVVWDGARWRPDIEVVRAFAQSFVVYVTAPATIRFERMKDRGEKSGEANLTQEQFLAEDAAPTEVFIERLGKDADFTIVNDGTLQDLQVQVERFCKNAGLLG